MQIFFIKMSEFFITKRTELFYNVCATDFEVICLTNSMTCVLITNYFQILSLTSVWTRWAAVNLRMVVF